MVDEYEWTHLRSRAGGHPASSPRALAQEMVATPWQSVVAAIMHVKTSRVQAHPALWKMLARWPGPEDLSGVGSTVGSVLELKDVLRPCGFVERRMEVLQTASDDWLLGLRPNAPGVVYGCGEYVSDSYCIFCLGDLRVAARDGELRQYVVWALGEKRGGDWRPPTPDGAA